MSKQKDPIMPEGPKFRWSSISRWIKYLNESCGWPIRTSVFVWLQTMNWHGSSRWNYRFDWLSTRCANGNDCLDVRPLMFWLVRRSSCSVTRSAGRHLRTEVIEWPRGRCSSRFLPTAVGCTVPRAYRTVSNREITTALVCWFVHDSFPYDLS